MSGLGVEIRSPRTLALRCLLLAMAINTISVLGTHARVSIGSSIYLASVSLLLSCLLVVLHNQAASSRLGAWMGAFVVALVVVWHLREQTDEPAALWGVGVLAVILTPVMVAMQLGVGLLDRRRAAVVIAACSSLLMATLVIGYQSSNLLRWHLLRQNTMFGTPLYYLLSEPVPAVESALTEPHRAAESPAHPAALPAISVGSLLEGVRTNFVYVLIDTLRSDSLAAWGSTESRMPRLDARSERCDRFVDVLANSSWTRPSIGSLFTGLLPEEHGARNFPDRLPESVSTLAEVLAESGWETAAFVTNTAAIGQELGFAQGFDLYHEFPQEPYVRARGVNRVVDRWLDDREDQATDDAPVRPLFLYVHYLDPHEPYLAGVVPGRPTAAAYREAYDAELAQLDEELAPFLDRLLERLGPETQLMVVSDHGEEFFEHELFGHGHSLYDEVVRIPALLCRSIQGGSHSERLEGRDLFDLVLAAAADPQIDLDRWSSEHARGERYLSLYYTGEGQLRLRPYRRYNLMRSIDRPDGRAIWSGYGETWELYDLRDSRQLSNLASQDPERLRGFAEALPLYPSYWTFPEPVAYSEEMRRRLESLGYLRGGGGED